MDTPINLDRSFSFNTNVSGLQAPTGGQTLVEGYYKGLIADMYINPEKNANRVVIKAKVGEGPFSGSVRTDGLNLPSGAEDKVRYYWRGLLESCGYTPAQLDAGDLSLSPEMFINRACFFYYKPKEQEGGYDTMRWLSPAVWEDQAANFVPSEAKPASSSSAGPVTINRGGTSNGAIGTTANKADILKRLGV
jgi:hypothetical protein